MRSRSLIGPTRRALETSFANGGQVSWGAGGPWAAPGIAWTAFKWLFKPHSPLVLRPRLDPAMWSWMLQFLRNATPARYAVNKSACCASRATATPACSNCGRKPASIMTNRPAAR